MKSKPGLDDDRPTFDHDFANSHCLIEAEVFHDAEPDPYRIYAVYKV